MFGSGQTLSGSIYVGFIKGKIGDNVTYCNPFFRKDDTSLLVRAFSDISFRFSTKPAITQTLGAMLKEG
ncbi:MAG: hypothetical protein ACPL7O_10960 [Armatimonadota bacterium]